MAVTKILAKDARLDKLIRYVVNPKKTGEQVFVSSIGCQPETAARTWMDTKRRFGRSDGVQAYHLIQSFRPGEITPELAHEIGNRFAERYLDGFEVIVGTHVDKAHVHNHIIFNSVSDRDGHKYHSSPASYFREIRGLSDRLCREYGLSVIDEPGKRALTYVEWRMQKLGILTQRQLVELATLVAAERGMQIGGKSAGKAPAKGVQAPAPASGKSMGSAVTDAMGGTMTAYGQRLAKRATPNMEGMA